MTDTWTQVDAAGRIALIARAWAVKAHVEPGRPAR